MTEMKNKHKEIFDIFILLEENNDKWDEQLKVEYVH